MKKRGCLTVLVEPSDHFEKKKRYALEEEIGPTDLQIDYVKTLGRRENKREQNEDAWESKPKKNKKKLGGSNTKQILW